MPPKRAVTRPSPRQAPEPEAPAPFEAVPDALPEELEGLDLRPNGTIAVGFPEPHGVIVLRRPRFGEFRRMREALWDLQDRRNEIVDEQKVLAESDDRDDALIRKLTVEIEDTTFDWVRDAVTTLGDKTPPAEADDWPHWATTGDVMNLIVSHWRSVPLARIGR